MELKEKLENLLKQKEQLEVTLFKVAGAIEMLQSLMSEAEKEVSKSKNKKENKK